MLKRENAVVVVVDVQDRLLPHIRKHEEVTEAVAKLIRGCRVLGVPVVVTEQYPEGLGPTNRLLKEEFDRWEPIVKSTFSCCGEGSFVEAVEKTGRKEVLLCGIEAHVCVYQTARDLLEKGYRVHLLVDGVSSRRKIDRKTAVARMVSMGAILATVEMALFEMLEVSGTEEFKKISKIVK
ncbi:MAG: hydrolase [Candidatus Eisenbacteria bacterium]